MVHHSSGSSPPAPQRSLNRRIRKRKMIVDSSSDSDHGSKSRDDGRKRKLDSGSSTDTDHEIQSSDSERKKGLGRDSGSKSDGDSSEVTNHGMQADHEDNGHHRDNGDLETTKGSELQRSREDSHKEDRPTPELESDKDLGKDKESRDGMARNVHVSDDKDSGVDEKTESQHGPVDDPDNAAHKSDSVDSCVTAPCKERVKKERPPIRRVYAGGLPPTPNEQSLDTCFNKLLTVARRNPFRSGNGVYSVYVHLEERVVFVELATVGKVTDGLGSYGIKFEGEILAVRKPSDGNKSSECVALDPTQLGPDLNLSAVGSTEGPEDSIVIRGFPNKWTDAQVRQFLERYGAVRYCDMVRDPETGESKDLLFCAYQDPSVTNDAYRSLAGLNLGGGKILRVKRANKTAAYRRLGNFESELAVQKSVGHPTRLVCIKNATNEDDLKDEKLCQGIIGDFWIIGGRHGRLVDVRMIVADKKKEVDEQARRGEGRVFLLYADMDGSAKAVDVLNGSQYGDNRVEAVYYSELKYKRGNYGL